MPNQATGIRQLIPACAAGSRIMKNINIAGKVLGFKSGRDTPIVNQILYAIYRFETCARDCCLSVDHQYRAHRNKASRQPFSLIEKPTNNAQVAY